MFSLFCWGGFSKFPDLFSSEAFHHDINLSDILRGEFADHVLDFFYSVGGEDFFMRGVVIFKEWSFNKCVSEQSNNKDIFEYLEYSFNNIEGVDVAVLKVIKADNEW